MSKHEMIEAIRQRNRSASNDFLVRFDEETLSTYLRRLTSLHGQRGRATQWVRATITPAITARACA